MPSPWQYICECGKEFDLKADAVDHLTSEHLLKERREIQHGTDAGYYAHRRRGETPCDQCKQAHSQAVRRWNNQWRRGFGFMSHRGKR